MKRIPKHNGMVLDVRGKWTVRIRSQHVYLKTKLPCDYGRHFERGQYSRQGRAEETRTLIHEYGEDVRQCVNTKDYSKLSPLHYAARTGQLECVRLLVEMAGAAVSCLNLLRNITDINVQTDERTTPLHFAARYRRSTDKPVLEFLGSKPDHQTNKWHQSEQSQREENRSTSVNLGDESFEDVDAQFWETAEVPSERLLLNQMVMSPTRARPMEPFDPVIHYLVTHGAELNGQDANGWTALHYAAIRGNQVAARQLVREPGINIE
ncbi:caskin-2, partial [Clonorchis sinensis]